MSIFLCMHIDRQVEENGELEWEIPECGGIGQNIVSEPDILDALENGGCMLLVQYVEWDDGEEESFSSPDAVLIQIEKARVILEALPETEYAHGKQPTLDDLRAMEKAVRWAIDEGHRVGFTAS